MVENYWKMDDMSVITVPMSGKSFTKEKRGSDNEEVCFTG